MDTDKTLGTDNVSGLINSLTGFLSKSADTVSDVAGAVQAVRAAGEKPAVPGTLYPAGSQGGIRETTTPAKSAEPVREQTPDPKPATANVGMIAAIVGGVLLVLAVVVMAIKK